MIYYDNFNQNLQFAKIGITLGPGARRSALPFHKDYLFGIYYYKNGRIFQNNTPVTKKFMGGEKLKEEQVLNIIELYKQGYSVDYLSDIFNVCKTSIKNIINKKTWKHITKDIQI